MSAKPRKCCIKFCRKTATDLHATALHLRGRRRLKDYCKERLLVDLPICVRHETVDRLTGLDINARAVWHDGNAPDDMLRVFNIAEECDSKPSFLPRATPSPVVAAEEEGEHEVNESCAASTSRVYSDSFVPSPIATEVVVAVSIEHTAQIDPTKWRGGVDVRCLICKTKHSAETFDWHMSHHDGLRANGRHKCGNCPMFYFMSDADLRSHLRDRICVDADGRRVTVYPELPEPIEERKAQIVMEPKIEERADASDENYEFEEVDWNEPFEEESTNGDAMDMEEITVLIPRHERIVRHLKTRTRKWRPLQHEETKEEADERDEGSVVQQVRTQNEQIAIHTTSGVLVVPPSAAFQCPLCIHSLPNRQSYNLHQLSVHNIPSITFMIECQQCAAAMPTEEMLADHRADAHRGWPGMGKHICAICRLPCEEEGELREHRKICHTTLACEHSDCVKANGKPMDSMKQFIDHVKSAHQCGVLFECPEVDCDVKCLSVGQVVGHRQQTHGRTDLPVADKGNPFHCPHCSFTSSSPSTVTLHIPRHGPSVRRLRCNYCPFTSLGKGNVDRHVVATHGWGRRTCDMCKPKGVVGGVSTKMYANHHTFLIHLIARHGIMPEEADTLYPAPPPVDDALMQMKHYQSSKIKYSFAEQLKIAGITDAASLTDRARELVKEHQYVNVVEASAETTTEATEHRCEECGFESRTRRGLKVHKLWIHKRQRRSGNVLNTVYNIRDTSHNELLPRPTAPADLKCPHCEMQLPNIERYDAHIVWHGSGTMGPTTTQQQTLLRRRVRELCRQGETVPSVVVAGGRRCQTHKCPTDGCGKVFITTTELRKHLEKHCLRMNSKANQLDKPICCTLPLPANGRCAGGLKCTYTRVDFYQRHRLVSHPDMGFACVQCGQAAETVKRLLVHIAERHPGSTLFDCDDCPQIFTFMHAQKVHRLKQHPNGEKSTTSRSPRAKPKSKDADAPKTKRQKRTAVAPVYQQRQHAVEAIVVHDEEIVTNSRQAAVATSSAQAQLLQIHTPQARLPQTPQRQQQISVDQIDYSSLFTPSHDLMATQHQQLQYQLQLLSPPRAQTQLHWS